MSASDSAMDTTVSNHGPHAVSLAEGWQGIKRGGDLTSRYRKSNNNGTELSTAIQLFDTIHGFGGVLNIEIADSDLEDDLDDQSDWKEKALSSFRKPGKAAKLYEDINEAVEETYYYASDEDQKSHRIFIGKELSTIYKMIVEPNQSGASSAAASPEEEDIDMEG
ncbi:hypothetical protein I350_00115 [Cryptococcus amylolentus CBS 6273]|uniref:Uncharacterized protein n=1 Tax=Cryptococcus amylolentus CBS 6273 TaxID=1296118 RepID=A0A1E3KEE2_9TREE|nr:hypothetical protein I350_00115 [Cryptococcus amylolentus CBS 6273]